MLEGTQMPRLEDTAVYDPVMETKFYLLIFKVS